MVDKEVVQALLLPTVPLKGYEKWEWGSQFGDLLDRRFPGQCGGTLGDALAYNDHGPAADHEIVRLTVLEEGERDESSWVWEVTFADGTTWKATGWCDYTGWDCQSGLAWEHIAPPTP